MDEIGNRQIKTTAHPENAFHFPELRIFLFSTLRLHLGAARAFCN